MGIVDKVRAELELLTKGKSVERSITTVEEYQQALMQYMYQDSIYDGAFVRETLAGQVAERIPNDFVAYARSAYASNGPVFALMAVRMMAFSSIRFSWQQITFGKPAKLFGNQALSILENPWLGGTTQDLLVGMITDVDLSGNWYGTVVGGELVRLRPDWVSIIMEPRIPNPRYPNEVLGYKKVGYVYREDGLNSGKEPVLLTEKEVAHFSPYPDPLATYRGMSWLTPVIRDMVNDNLMAGHQKLFFENAATPNMIVKLDAAVSFEDFLKFKAEFNLEHKGVRNAYKTAFLGGGADATVVGSDFQSMSFTSLQGKGETRLAAAAGVPATIVGFSEGLQGSSLNAGNFGQARRRLADLTMHPLWGNAAGSLQHLLGKPSGGPSRLWYDTRDVPFLREDAKDAAEIMRLKSAVIASLINSGWEPDTAKSAVVNDDFDSLVHTGLVSVQLQPPGTVAETPVIEATTEEGE